MNLPLHAQLINLFAALLLVLAFAMLTQRRILSLINLFALQGFVLVLSTSIVAGILMSGSTSHRTFRAWISRCRTQGSSSTFRTSVSSAE